MTIKLGVIMDPISGINPKKDTTLGLLLAARGTGKARPCTVRVVAVAGASSVSRANDSVSAASAAGPVPARVTDSGGSSDNRRVLSPVVTHSDAVAMASCAVALGKDALGKAHPTCAQTAAATNATPRLARTA